MPDLDCDVIVVGSGAAGPVGGARRLGRRRQGHGAGEVARTGRHDGNVGGGHLGAVEPSHAGRRASRTRPRRRSPICAPPRRPAGRRTRTSSGRRWRRSRRTMLRFVEDETPLRLRAGQSSRFLRRGAGRQAVRPHGLADLDQPLHPRPLVEPGAQIGEAAVLHLQGDGRRHPQGSVARRSPDGSAARLARDRGQGRPGQRPRSWACCAAASTRAAASSPMPT